MRWGVLIAACAALGLLLPGGRALAQTVTVPGVPTSIAATSTADSLTVTWAAPDDDGGAAVTAYDLRYIETDDDETADANWILVEDAWTSGALSYSITGPARQHELRRAATRGQQRG